MCVVCLAWRPWPSVLFLFFVFILFFSFLVNHTDALLTYDHETLLNIQLATEKLRRRNTGRQAFFRPLFLPGTPAYLRCTPAPPYRRKHLKWRSKRVSLLVKLKICLELSPGDGRIHSDGILAELSLFVAPAFCLLSLLGTCLHLAGTIIGTSKVTLLPRVVSPRFRSSGVKPQNLGHLEQIPWMANLGPWDVTRHIALVNARASE